MSEEDIHKTLFTLSYLNCRGYAVHNKTLAIEICAHDTPQWALYFSAY
jgi:hypothetical protein